MYVCICMYIYMVYRSSTEYSTIETNLSCLKRRRLYTTKVSYYLESSCIIFVL